MHNCGVRANGGWHKTKCTILCDFWKHRVHYIRLYIIYCSIFLKNIFQYKCYYLLNAQRLIDHGDYVLVTVLSQIQAGNVLR